MSKRRSSEDTKLLHAVEEYLLNEAADEVRGRGDLGHNYGYAARVMQALATFLLFRAVENGVAAVDQLTKAVNSTRQDG
jgi:hypothetical protein